MTPTIQSAEEFQTTLDFYFEYQGEDASNKQTKMIEQRDAQLIAEAAKEARDEGFEEALDQIKKLAKEMLKVNPENDADLGYNKAVIVLHDASYALSLKDKE